MSFIDSYKRLEKLCSEIYSENNGLSVYINEMNNNSNGSYYVLGWDVRRNQRVLHAPNTKRYRKNR